MRQVLYGYTSSVCVSVGCWYCVDYILFSPSGRANILSFWTFYSNPLTEGVKYPTWMVLKIGVFDQNSHLSQKQYEIGPRLLWITNRKS